MAVKTYSATVTPLLENGNLDKEGLKNILERNIRHGLSGVFLLGSMGEWGSFSDDFKDGLGVVVQATDDALVNLIGNAHLTQVVLHLIKVGLALVTQIVGHHGGVMDDVPTGGNLAVQRTHGVFIQAGAAGLTQIVLMSGQILPQGV